MMLDLKALGHWLAHSQCSLHVRCYHQYLPTTRPLLRLLHCLRCSCPLSLPCQLLYFLPFSSFLLTYCFPTEASWKCHYKNPLQHLFP